MASDAKKVRFRALGFFRVQRHDFSCVFVYGVRRGSGSVT